MTRQTICILRPAAAWFARKKELTLVSTARGRGRRVRRRRSPEEARDEALAAARKLLLRHGPGGVTLVAVADDIGMTHGNLIHHFGSAAELHAALMGSMVRDLAAAIGAVVAHVRSDESAPRALVDIVFDAFDKRGAALLAAWIALSNRHAHLEPVRAAVVDLVRAIDERSTAEGVPRPRHIPSAILFVTLCAFGDAVIGPQLREMLGRDRNSVRRVAAHLVPSFF
jgi:AcrR family transcriptional regulator